MLASQIPGWRLLATYIQADPSRVSQLEDKQIQETLGSSMATFAFPLAINLPKLCHEMS